MIESVYSNKEKGTRSIIMGPADTKGYTLASQQDKLEKLTQKKKKKTLHLNYPTTKQSKRDDKKQYI